MPRSRSCQVAESAAAGRAFRRAAFVHHRTVRVVIVAAAWTQRVHAFIPAHHQRNDTERPAPAKWADKHCALAADILNRKGTRRPDKLLRLSRRRTSIIFFLFLSYF